LVTNTGVALPITGITVTDTLGTPVCVTSGNATIASLAAGASEPCTFTYVATQVDFDGNGGGDGDIDNSASASGTVGGQPTSAIGATSVALILNPQLTIVKSANTAGPAAVNDVITYTYAVTNTGNLTISGVTIADVHNGYGTLPVPAGETLSLDAAPLGDSTDATAGNSVWSVLAPGDKVTFTATYTVTQTDVDLLQ
jgi:large repetitive protein